MRKTISIFLTLLVLVSSTGLAMTTHYCGGYAMDNEVALGQVHLDCGMEDMDDNPCPGEKNKHTIDEQFCCNNVSISSDTDNHNLLTAKSFNPEFALAFAITYQELFNSDAETEQTFFTYSPPLLLRDIPVLNQVFII